MSQHFFARKGAFDVLLTSDGVVLGKADAMPGDLRIAGNTKAGFLTISRITGRGSKRLGGYWDGHFHWVAAMEVTQAVLDSVRSIRADDFIQVIACNLNVDAKHRAELAVTKVQEVAHA